MNMNKKYVNVINENLICSDITLSEREMKEVWEILEDLFLKQKSFPEIDKIINEHLWDLYEE